jgi:hypothetical protein
MAVMFLSGVVAFGQCVAKPGLNGRGEDGGEITQTSSTDVSASASIRQGHFTKEDIDAMLIRPVNGRELLQNINTIMKRGLLAEPLFYSDAALLKAFNGVSVLRKSESGSAGGGAGIHKISVVVHAAELRGLTVTLSENRVPTGKQVANGVVTERFVVSGNLELHVEGMPSLTVGLVRNIIGNGRETEDFGNATDGGHVPVAFKGRIFYEIPNHKSEARVELARSETIIFVRKGSDSNEDPTVSQRRWSLTDGDLIQEITISQLEQ